MVKSVSSVSHRGLSDWVIQRLSAVYMAIFSVAVFAYLACHSNMTYADWHDLFGNPAMKVFSLLFLLALMFHAWIGVWTIFTDYVKPFVLRAILNCLVLLVLAVSFLWGVLVLWSV